MHPFTIDCKLVFVAHDFCIAHDVMLRVAGNNFGASQGLVVAPGHEEQGVLTVAGGQSGHPLSPFYGAGHQGWLEGRATPLLAGETRHTIRFLP